MKLFFLAWNPRYYKYLFPSKKDLVGEITPDYFYLSEKTIKKIKYLYPNLKIIISLKNPIDRAWSLFKIVKLKHHVYDKPVNSIYEITKSEIIDFLNETYFMGAYYDVLQK